MAINSSPFLTVADGYAIAASSSYLYACYGTSGGASTKLIRSTDGVDWVDDPGTIANVGTLVEGSSHIVVTGSSISSTRVLDKSGTTWSTIGSITEAATGGRYVGGKYFVFCGTKLYYSSDTVNWLSLTLAYTVKDVGYDGTHYLILTTSRIYRTSDLSTLTAYPIAFTGVSIVYFDDLYWVSGYTGASPTIIYRSSDLNAFTATWNSPGGMYALLSVVDGVLVFGSGGNDLLLTGYYYYNPAIAGYIQTLIDLGYTDNAARLGLCFKHHLYVNNGYVYTSGGNIRRAVYNTGWNTTTGVLAVTEGADAVQLTGASQSGTGTIQGTLRLDTSTGAFAARKVYLYSYTTGAKLAETTSDGTTGAWSFTAIVPGEYFVVGVAEGADLSVPRDFDALGVITVV